ncbi:MAG: 16S rRNA methyltransferase [Candidatus Thermoplasmatota archaeon]|nr:16S rRNA methyltransferase [Candidatus Thermoplasmatota archaeon]
MLRIILADAELELIPEGLFGHPSVRSYAKRRGKPPERLLMDGSFVHSALNRLPDGDRRGRPDIVHVFLLVCLDSILNLRGQLETLVHTRNNEVISISQETRLPKNYNRFLGLMESLFERGVVPSKENPLLRLERDLSLGNLLDRFRGQSIALTEDAPLMDPVAVFEKLGPDVNCIVGGFPRGDFLSPVRELTAKRFSLWREPLKIWTVASELTTSYGRVADSKGKR